MLPLKEVRVNDQMSTWMKLLQPSKPSRPEVYLRTRVLRADIYYAEVAEMNQPGSNNVSKQLAPASATQFPSSAQKSMPAPSKEKIVQPTEMPLIEIGSEGGLDLRFSLTLTALRGLESFGAPGGGPFYLYYQIFDSDFRSQPLSAAGRLHPAQRKEFGLVASRKDLLAYFSEPLTVYVCRGARALGQGSVNLAPLLQQWLSEDPSQPLVLLDSLEVEPMEGIVFPAGGRTASISLSLEVENQDSDLSIGCITPPRLSLSMRSQTSEKAIEPNDEEEDQSLTNIEEVKQSLDTPPAHAPRSLGSEYVQLFKLHVELTALRALQPANVLASVINTADTPLASYLAHPQPESWLYARFEYPLLLGSAHVFSNPACYLQASDSGPMTVVSRVELGAALFAFEFAMSARNLSVALEEAALGVEVWRMGSVPAAEGQGRAAVEGPQDELIGRALVPLRALGEARRETLGDGERVRNVEQCWAVRATESSPPIGHVEARLQLDELGAYETARTRDQQLREQLDTTRAKVEELWDACEKQRKKAEKLETRLLVAEFEEQMALNQDREDYQKSRQAHVHQIQAVEERLVQQQELNRECIAALEETERTAMAETARRVQLEKEIADLRSRLTASTPASAVRPTAKRTGSVSSPLLRKVHQSVLIDASNLINDSSASLDISNMSSAPEQENLC